MEIRAITRSFVDLFFPRRCLGCNCIVSNQIPMCINCIHRLPFTYWKFDQNNDAFHKIRNLCPIESANSLLYFEKSNVTQHVLHALKYKNQPKAGILLADLMKIENLNSSFDGIIVVPIHPKKLKKRGYNQVLPFAKRLGERTQIPLIDNYLIRTKFNKSQVEKSRTQRLTSLSNAFEVLDKNLTGHFLLVDDLLTTGATISTCVNLLKSKNDIKISVLTIGFAV